MSKQIYIELKNDLSEINRLSERVNDFAEANNLSPKTLFALNLSLEEVITNVISYGFDDDKEHQILVHIYSIGGEISVEIEDDGKPFNPLQVDEPDLTIPLEERPIGGLGIHLIRNYMDDLEYKRDGYKNILRMKKKSNTN